MILIDFSQIVLSAIHSDAGTGDLDESFIRHICFNIIRSYNKKYRARYGAMVIACDNSTGGGYWRTKEFEAYKYRRKAGRESSDLDWETIFKIMQESIAAMTKHFPYKVLTIPGCEADDIIGALTEKYHSQEDIMIVSSDKDFKQLQRYPSVKQFSPILKKQLVEANAIRYLKEHIIRGDGGDDIPNILTRSTFFKDKLHKERQPSIFAKKLDGPDGWINKSPEEFCETDEIHRRFRENQKLIDLTFIPSDIKAQIYQTFDEAATDDSIFIYFMQNGLDNLLNYMEDFELGLPIGSFSAAKKPVVSLNDLFS